MHRHTSKSTPDAGRDRATTLRQVVSDHPDRGDDRSRDKLEAAVEEVKEVRRTAKDALFHQSEVARLEKLLSEAGVDSRKRGTNTSLRMEVFRLRQDLRSSEAAKDTSGVRPSKAAPTRKPDKGTVATLRRAVDSLTRKNARLHKALERARERKDEPRYTGAVYRASGWIRVGTTQGRGRYDTHMKRAEPRKDIWLRPLRKDWKRTLNR